MGHGLVTLKELSRIQDTSEVDMGHGLVTLKELSRIQDIDIENNDIET